MLFGFTNSFYNQWPNLAAYQSLGNRYYVTDFGGQGVGSPQHNIYADGYSPLIYALAQGFGNTNHISQWNPMLIGMDLTQSMNTNPMLNMQGNIAAYNWGASLAMQAKLSSQLNNLSNLEAQLGEILKSDKLDESQKQRLQDVLDQVKALKEKVQKMLEKGQLKTEELEAIQGEIAEVIENASKTAQEVLAEVKETQEAEEAENSNTSEDTADADESNESDDDGAGSVDPDTEVGKKQKETENQATEICQNIYDGSIGCTGTNYGTIKKGTNKINKDNVTTVLNTWQEQYQPSTGDANLIETLFDEEMFWNPSLHKPKNGHVKIENPKNNMDIIWNIVVALDEKAQELGVKNNLAGQFAVCYDELDDTFVNQSAIQNAVQKICEEVTKAEAKQAEKDVKTEKADKAKADAEAKKAQEKAKADAKKAEKEQKEAKKIEEQKTQFINDMREILGDDKAQISEKVKYENGKFVVRINGKNYYGKDYLELAKALEKAGYEPEQYLKKESAAKKAA